MSVLIGSARIDERGKATGGKAGDQGNEVSTQNWYAHSKGWRVLRPISVSDAENIAACMEMACKNQHIGYDQAQRNSLYNAAKGYDFDVSKVNANVETDCSALVRVCCAYAGIKLSDFNTSSEASTLLRSGMFVEKTDSDYTKKSDYLRRGDVLVTKSKGHTVVVLSNGTNAGFGYQPAPAPTYHLGERVLKNGMAGNDVKELQQRLAELGYSVGSYGADGEFGDSTEMAVRTFQTDYRLEVDGEFGEKSYAALVTALGSDANNGYNVKITGGNCYVRTAPNTDANKLGIAREGEMYQYGGKQSENGWYLIEYKSQNAWVSGKYGRLV